MTSFAAVAIEWSQGFEDAWSDVATFVPKAAAFLAVLVIGYIVAKFVTRVCRKLLERVGFDRAVERGPVKDALAKSKYHASDLAAKFVYFALLLVVLQMAFRVFGDNQISEMIPSIIAYLPKLLVAIAIVVVAAMVSGVVRDLVASSLSGLSYGPMLGTLAAGAIMVFAGFAALSQLQIAPAIVHATFYALLAIIAGSAIIAIGGGGIQPMRQRWEQTLNRYDEEKPRMREQIENARASRREERGAVEATGAVDVSRSEERTPYGTQR
jgi:hypothetical protein